MTSSLLTESLICRVFMWTIYASSEVHRNTAIRRKTAKMRLRISLGNCSIRRGQCCSRSVWHSYNIVGRRTTRGSSSCLIISWRVAGVKLSSLSGSGISGLTYGLQLLNVLYSQSRGKILAKRVRTEVEDCVAVEGEICGEAPLISSICSNVDGVKVLVMT